MGTPAHTTNDVLAWLPRQSVLFCGDLVFNGGHRFCSWGRSRGGAMGGLERGGPINVMTALDDMVTYNGGKPLTCLA